MIKGTDLVLSIQLLILRYTDFISHYRTAFDPQAAIESDTEYTDETFGSFLSLRDELKHHLQILGNECDCLNMDNLKEFVAERRFPPLPFRDTGSWVLRTVENQLHSLLQTYQHALKIEALPINVESVMLRHLAELQSITCNFLNRRGPSYKEKPSNRITRELVSV